MSEKKKVESKLTIRKSGRGYGSTWIHIPSKLAKDSSFHASQSPQERAVAQPCLVGKQLKSCNDNGIILFAKAGRMMLDTKKTGV